jgi:membrane protein DedA with SNARE-associated domain
LGDVTSILADLAVRYGYAGVFVTTVLGSVVPFLPFPNFVVVILLSNILDPVYVGLLAGIGGALGKLTSYLLGRGGYGLAKARTRDNLDVFRGFAGRYGGLGIFVLAVIPIRDEVYAIPMGMVRFPIWRFLLANAAGKVILYTAVAYLGRFFLTTLAGFLGEGEVIATIMAFMITVVITVLLRNANWKLALELYQKDGLPGVISSLARLFEKDEKGRAQ